MTAGPFLGIPWMKIAGPLKVMMGAMDHLSENLEIPSLRALALRFSLPVIILASAQAAFMLKCGGDPDGASTCPEGQIRVDGSCTDYVPGDPADPGDAWRPETGTTWQWQLTGDLDTSLDVQMYDVDLFEVTDEELASLSDRISSMLSWAAWTARVPTEANSEL